jgi:hypothetical protein
LEETDGTMEWFTGIVVILFAASAIYGWFHDKSKELKEDEYNRNLKIQLHDEKQKFQSKPSPFLAVEVGLLDGFLASHRMGI